MQIRRFLFALTCASSAMTAAFADYQSLNPAGSSDRLEELSRALGAGSYTTTDGTDDLSDNSPVQFSASGSTSWMSVYPVKESKSRVSSTYGMRTLMGTTRQHSGIDLAAPSGTPIYATGSGVVTISRWGRGYGNYIEIDHGNGYMTRYAHASRLNVNVGDRVSAGQEIASVGCTGRCTGPHLHFEVLKSGKRQNPATYLAMLE